MSDLKEKQKEAIEAALNDIASGVAGILTSDEWKAWLSHMAKFRSYSARNVLWMWAQWEHRRTENPELPEFSQPAAFSTWKKLGRSVLKGEKALTVLAPVTIKKVEKDTGKERRVLIGFKAVRRTFDVSQTHGDELPENPAGISPLEGEADETLWEALLDVAASINFPVKLEPMPSGLHGYCRYEEQDMEKPPAGVIRVREDNPRYHQIKTLIHEIAHAMLHSPQEYDRAHDGSRSVIEVEAESVAYVVADAFGMDTAGYSFGYVAQWAADDPRVLAESATRIIDTATRILTAAETGEMPRAGQGVKRPEVADKELAAV